MIYGDDVSIAELAEENAMLRRKLEIRKNKIKDLEDALANEKQLNEDLLRIHREKANQERGIRPKKSKSGYKVIREEEKQYVFMARALDSFAPCGMSFWETLITTPFSKDINHEAAKQQIEDFLLGDKTSSGRLFKCGLEEIRYVVNSDDIWKYTAFEEQSPDPEQRVWLRASVNVLMGMRYQIFKSGYWEVTIKHTLPLLDIWKLEEL